MGVTRGFTRKAKQHEEKPSKKRKLDNSDSNEFLDKAKLLTATRYDMDQILRDERFNTTKEKHLCKEMNPEDFTMDYYDKTGLQYPIRFKCDPTALGMKVPPPTFTIDDVAKLVGKNRLVDVIRVEDQGTHQMTVGDFVDYFKTPDEDKKQIYNVLSLEYDLSPLRSYIESPDLVRRIDWIEQWPKNHRLISQWSYKDSGEFKIIAQFPKVSHYCLISPNKSYTDFHVDFGGSSVWYHVLKGSKIFFLIEPTGKNLQLYEQHLLKNKSGFLGYAVDRCFRVIIEAGQTLILPSGWIHAVYTPTNSLVFGGNFVHTLACSMQIQAVKSENRIKLGPNYRLPFFEELQFYVISNIVENATGRKYLRPYSSIMNVAFDGDSFVDGVKSKDGRKETYYDLQENAGQLKQSKGRSKSSALHKLKIDEKTEGRIEFNNDYLRSITSRALTELTVLYRYLKTKSKLNIPEGITRPASLLNSFQQLLNHRRNQLEKFDLPVTHLDQDLDKFSNREKFLKEQVQELDADTRDKIEEPNEETSIRNQKSSENGFGEGFKTSGAIIGDQAFDIKSEDNSDILFEGEFLTETENWQATKKRLDKALWKKKQELAHMKNKLAEFDSIEREKIKVQSRLSLHCPKITHSREKTREVDYSQ